MISILIMYMLIASTFTLGKAVLSYGAPFFFIGVRMTIAGVLMIGYYLLCDRAKITNIRREHLGLFAWFGFMQISSYISEYWSLQYVTSVKSCLLFNLTPFVTAIWAYLLVGERLTGKQWLSLCIGFVGMLPIMLDNVAIENVAGHVFSFSLPELVLLISVATYSYVWIIMKQLLKHGYGPGAINGIGAFGGGLLALVLALCVEWRTGLIRVPTDGLLIGFFGPWGSALCMFSFYSAALIIVGTIIAYNMYGWLLKRHSATFLALAGLTTPLFAAVYGSIFLGEAVTWRFFVSMIITSYGLYLFYQDEFKNGLKGELRRELP